MSNRKDRKQDNKDRSSETGVWVFQKKVELLYSNQRQSWLLSILASVLIAFLALDAGQYKAGAGWWLVFISITLFRTWNTMRFCHLHEQNKVVDFERWLKKFYLYTFLTACAWCVGAILIGSKLDELSQVYIFIVLLGVSAAAIPLLGVIQGVMLIFQIPTTVPYLLYIAIMFEGKGTVLVYMFGLYMVGVIVAIKRMDSNLSESLSMQYEKSQLVNSLSISNMELMHANEQLETLSMEDALTGLHNRRFFEMKLESEWKRDIRERTVLSLMVIDIDYFKLYNDTYGHAEGDECLKEVADVLRSSLQRAADIVARIGGEEFVILLPGLNGEKAQEVARLIQKRLAHAGLVHATSPLSEFVTISIGISSVIPDKQATPLMLFKVADKALYKAKSQGRNKIVLGEMEVLKSQEDGVVRS